MTFEAYKQLLKEHEEAGNRLLEAARTIDKDIKDFEHPLYKKAKAAQILMRGFMPLIEESRRKLSTLESLKHDLERGLFKETSLDLVQNIQNSIQSSSYANLDIEVLNSKAAELEKAYGQQKSKGREENLADQYLQLAIYRINAFQQIALDLEAVEEEAQAKNLSISKSISNLVDAFVKQTNALVDSIEEERRVVKAMIAHEKSDDSLQTKSIGDKFYQYKIEELDKLVKCQKDATEVLRLAEKMISYEN